MVFGCRDFAHGSLSKTLSRADVSNVGGSRVVVGLYCVEGGVGSCSGCGGRGEE